MSIYKLLPLLNDVYIACQHNDVDRIGRYNNIAAQFVESGNGQAFFSYYREDKSIQVLTMTIKEIKNNRVLHPLFVTAMEPKFISLQFEEKEGLFSSISKIIAMIRLQFGRIIYLFWSFFI